MDESVDCFVHECLMTGNTSLYSGSAIYKKANSLCGIGQTTITGNASSEGMATVYTDSGWSCLTIDASLITLNTGAAFGAGGDLDCDAELTCTNLYGNSSDWTPPIDSQAHLNGNMSADPLFCGAGVGDYGLRSGSPGAPANNECGRLIGCFDVGCWCCIIRGDIDYNQFGPDIADLVFLVNYMFSGGPLPVCTEACDIDGDGLGPDIADLVHLVSYMFSGGPPPAVCD
ncbi:MAG: hypothetical protein ABIE70_09345 [bacterium]